jgi:hypothetical protein
MTGAMMNPRTLVENTPDAVLLREMIEMYVEELTGAARRPIAAPL